MMDVLYGGLGARERAIISIPFGLYQCEYFQTRVELMLVEQVVLSQLLSNLFKWWNDRPDVYFPGDESRCSTDVELESAVREGSIYEDKGK